MNLKTLLRWLIKSILRFTSKSNSVPSVQNFQDFEYRLTKLRLLNFLEKSEINTVIDVGASSGDFVEIVKNTKPNANIYAFEPIGDIFDTLKVRFGLTKQIFLYNTAVGNIDGNIDFYQNHFTHSSSILPIGEKHIEEFPFTKNFIKTKVPIRRLDTISHEISLIKPILIKIDVQGYEREVISGAEKVFSLADYLIIEVSFCELYEGQPLFNNINQQLNSLGFTFSGVLHQLYSSGSSSILQADALYIKSTKLST